MPLITRNSQNANVKLGTTAQLAAITFTDGDLASDTTLNKLKIFDGSTLQNVGTTSFSSSAVVSQSTSIGDYTTPTAAVVTSPISTVEYLVIAGGGGGGGGDRGGGGGAGGYKTDTGFQVSIQTYTITVGAGGAGGNDTTSDKGTSGSNSVFSSITSTGGGGGGGGANDAAKVNGRDGGSGGGGGNGGGVIAGTAGSASPASQGNAGGTGSGSAPSGFGAGGGGGSSAAGQNGTSSSGTGQGGAGTSSNITGSSVIRAGGGGGGNNLSEPLGGSGGGGNGGNRSTPTNGTAGTVNTGSGGGGAGNAGAGGSGVVIIKYLTANITATGGTMTTSGANTIHTFNSSSSFVVTALNAGNEAIDDNVTTKWTSSSESNPNIYVDMGSALNLCAAAFYFDSTDTTNTEILIQSSADASTWTTKRTITTSNLTNGAYNYYRFNIAGGSRYIRFYGNSAGSTVLSIWEIKVLKKTDAEIFNDLGILTITASDTTLGPDGT